MVPARIIAVLAAGVVLGSTGALAQPYTYNVNIDVPCEAGCTGTMSLTGTITVANLGAVAAADISAYDFTITSPAHGTEQISGTNPEGVDTGYALMVAAGEGLVASEGQIDWVAANNGQGGGLSFTNGGEGYVHLLDQAGSNFAWVYLRYKTAPDPITSRTYVSPINGVPIQLGTRGEDPGTAWTLPTPGDITGGGTTNVVDGLCLMIAVLLNTFGGGPTPACLAVPASYLDFNCDGSVNVIDVQLAVLISTGTTTIPGDGDSNGVPDACE